MKDERLKKAKGKRETGIKVEKTYHPEGEQIYRPGFPPRV